MNVVFLYIRMDTCLHMQVLRVGGGLRSVIACGLLRPLYNVPLFLCVTIPICLQTTLLLSFRVLLNQSSMTNMINAILPGSTYGAKDSFTIPSLAIFLWLAYLVCLGVYRCRTSYESPMQKRPDD